MLQVSSCFFLSRVVRSTFPRISRRNISSCLQKVKGKQSFTQYISPHAPASNFCTNHKMAAPISLNSVNKYIDDNFQTFVTGLKDAVAIKSVSSTFEGRLLATEMVNNVAERMKMKLGMNVEVRENPNTDADGKPLPPVLLASLGNDPAKKTLCIYGHLDVQPASKDDGWETDDPFVMEIKGERMIGRGSSDDKGPVLGWLNTVEAFQKTNTPIPLNLKFVFEGMEESGSQGLDSIIETEKDLFFADVDYISVSDNYWLGTRKPCLTYGLRGIIYFHCKVNCAKMDLHSGVHGGPVHEAMVDLVALLGSLLDKEGKILVDGVYDKVRKVTPEEEKLYKDLDFSMDQYQSEIGAHALNAESEMETLMKRWRHPSLSIHGIQGAFYEQGDKTVIPKEVVGKFSIRLVPDQTPKEIGKLVIKHLNAVHTGRGSPNKLHVTFSPGAALPWLGDFSADIFEAGKLATVETHGVEPDYTREGGSIPVVLTLGQTTGKDVLLLPMGRSDDGAHSQNEKLDQSNFLKGMKLFGSYLKHLSELASKRS